MSDSKLSVCSECGSKYIAASSKMKAMCPECASILYGDENCDHVFKDGRCIKCFWDGNRSAYIQRLVDGRSDKMDLFRDKYTALQKEFGLGKKMVLSTSENSRVSSRMMSVIHINGEFYCVRIECPMISVHFIIEYPTYMTYYSILFSCAVGVNPIGAFF